MSADLILAAWIKFLEDYHNAKAVKIGDVFKVVPVRCDNCSFKNTNKTKNCWSPTSFGCGKWEYMNETF